MGKKLRLFDIKFMNKISKNTMKMEKDFSFANLIEPAPKTFKTSRKYE